MADKKIATRPFCCLYFCFAAALCLFPAVAAQYIWPLTAPEPMI